LHSPLTAEYVLDRETLDGTGRVASGRTQVRGNDSSRLLVGTAARSFSRALHLHRLRDVGRLSGRALRIRSVPVAVLLAAALRRGPFSAALFILWAPGGFRVTCYYYRGAYYKAFWADPPSCTVGEPRKSYWGERSFPLIIQNIHRYFLYLGLLFIVVLTYDAIMSFRFPDGFGVGVGSLVLTVNTILLAGYTFSCHSLRHIIGGRKDEIAGNALQSGCYSCVSALNRKHQLFAWLSLCSVAFADLYVRFCSMGVWTDYRLL
jgi:hypothetical protein